MSHFRAFVANQVWSRIRNYFGVFCPDFYSDIEDFTQILCRYLPKKLAAKTSASGAAPSSELEVVSFPELLIKFKSTVFLYHIKQKTLKCQKI